jgi:hypothetical protein
MEFEDRGFDPELKCCRGHCLPHRLKSTTDKPQSHRRQNGEAKDTADRE